MQPSWEVVEAWATQQIDSLTQQLESDIQDSETQKVRGAIRQLRLLLALPNQAGQRERLSSIQFGGPWPME